MNTLLFSAASFAVLIFLMYLINKFVWAPKLKREAEAAPRITLSEVETFWKNIEDSALPMAKADVQITSTPPSSSRIGGAPLAIGEDKSWPTTARNGFPMAFIAQINFSEMPPIEDFPTQGILQIFTSFDLIDDVGECERVIRWDPDPKADKLLEIPPEIMKKTRQTKGFSERVRHSGLALIFESDTAMANPFNWPHEEKNPIYENRLPETDKVKAILDEWEDRTDKIIDGYGTHWLGGHPNFVQEDVRLGNPECRQLDRVIFHLGSDEDINIGDGGEVNVMISRQALLKQEFQKAYLTWDCG